MIKTEKPEPTSPTKLKHKPPTEKPSEAMTSLTELTEESLTKYLKNFVTINDYKTIEQGKDLLKLLTTQSNVNVLQKAVKMLCFFIEHAKAQGKVCGLQFLKELMDLGRPKIFLVTQKYLTGILIDVLEYRNHIKSMVRGSTYFMEEIDKNQKQAKVADLVRLSNTFFRMSHEMVYVWGVRYFPHSHFGVVYNKLSKYCTFPVFPSDFKFYRIAKIEQLQKSQTIKSIDQLVKNRKSIDVPALSNRSRGSRSNRKLSDGPLISNRSKKSDDSARDKNADINDLKVEQKIIKKEKIEEKEPQQDIFEAQRTTGSKIVQRGSKIVSKPPKPSEKIPRNIIYRQSSVEDPVDMTRDDPEAQKLSIKNRNSIEVPLGIIPEVTTEDGSSKAKSKNISVTEKQKGTKIAVETLNSKMDFKKKDPQVVKQEVKEREQQSQEVSSERVGHYAESVESQPQKEEAQTKKQPSKAAKPQPEPKKVHASTPVIQIQKQRSEIELPIDSCIDQSSVSIQKRAKVKGKKFVKHYTERKIRRKSESIFQEETERIQPSSESERKKVLRKLTVSHAYDVKQLGQATNIMQKIKSDQGIQKELQTERKVLNQRRLRKFKEVSITFIPESNQNQERKVQKLRSQLSQSYKSQIEHIKQELSVKIAQMDQKSTEKADQHLRHISQILKDHVHQLLPSASLIPKSKIKSNRKIESRPQSPSSSFFNEDLKNNLNSNLNVNDNYSHGKPRSRSNSTKRSSLSQIRNQNEALFEPGTMLFYMAKRKSVLL